MKEPKWMKDYNILHKDFVKLSFACLVVLWITVTLVLYPLLCMFNDSSEIREEIKDGFKTLFES